MDGPRDEVDHALGQAVQVAGPDIVRHPQRLRAILADLVGIPGSDHRDEIGVIVDVVDLVADSGVRDEEHIVAELGRRRSGEAVEWAVSTLVRHGAPIEPAPDRNPTPVWRRPWALASMVVALIAILIIFLVVPDGDPDESTTTAESESTSTEPDESTTTTDPTPEIVGYRVDFEQAVEGAFVAQRTWEIRDGQVSGTVVLSPTSDSGLTQHRELLPTNAFTSPVFTPEPTNTNGDIASYSLDLAAGPATITFVADLTATEPDQATIESWVENWRERVPSLRPVDTDAPATATVTALT